MKSTAVNKNRPSEKERNATTFDLQKLHTECMERFMTLVALSYALKSAPRIIHKK
jgi:hypothetical protein